MARVHSVHVMNVEQHQAAADPQTKSLTWAVSPPVGCYHLQPVDHHCNLLLLLSSKAATHLLPNGQ